MNATASTISLQSVVSLSGSIWFNFSLLNPNVSGTYSLSMRSRTSASILSRTFPNMDYLDLPIKDVGPAFWVNNN